MTAPLPLDRLCIHQVTLMQCDFRESIECLARHGVRKTAVWVEKLDEVGADEGARILQGNGVESVSLCFGGLLTGDDDGWRDANLRRIEQAANIGAKSLVTITGGLPEGQNDLAASRDRAIERLASLLPHARGAGVTLALEPLHPMVCGFRSVISSIGDALDMIDSIGADDLGIALDAYGLWWDSGLRTQIERAGSRIVNFHTSDWLCETGNLRLDRGMPGDGMIDNRTIRGWLEKTGFDGPVEVEIFSQDNWWKREPDAVVETIVSRLPLL